MPRLVTLLIHVPINHGLTGALDRTSQTSLVDDHEACGSVSELSGGRKEILAVGLAADCCVVEDISS